MPWGLHLCGAERSVQVFRLIFVYVIYFNLFLATAARGPDFTIRVPLENANRILSSPWKF